MGDDPLHAAIAMIISETANVVIRFMGGDYNGVVVEMSFCAASSAVDQSQ